jgi:hypothetical protein
MKNVLIPGSLVAFALFSFGWYVSPGGKPVSLNEVIQKNIASVEFSSVGGHSGKCVTMKLVNNTGKDHVITIPAGTILEPGDSTMQNIFIVEDQEILLSSKQKKNCTISGFCCQASDRSPSAGTSFKIGNLTNEKLLALAKFTSGKKFSDETLQAAVWCISDSESVSYVTADDKSKIQPLRDLICTLTGQKDVWYSTGSTTSIGEDGYISRVPTVITGMIGFNVDQPTTVTQVIRSADGTFEYKINADMTVPKAGKYEYDFRLKVNGWNKGKYFISINAGEKEILKQEFEI